MRPSYSVSLLALFLLAACATAVSQTPSISKQELAEEQQAQDAYIKAEKSKQKSAAKAVDRSQMLERLKTVGGQVSGAAQKVCAELQVADCSFPFALDKDSATEVNAYTDGQKIVVSPAMMNFAEEDDQLAVVLSHEYSHALMGHPGKTQRNAAVGGLLGMAVDTLARTQGFDTGGALSKFGAQGAVLRYSQNFEREADYIGMYVLARTGYPIEEASRLWRRMATVNPEGVYNGSTHPTTAERYILLKKTAAEIKAKQAGGAALLPERLPE